LYHYLIIISDRGINELKSNNLLKRRELKCVFQPEQALQEVL
jgi:ribosomal protein S24E